MQCVVCKNSSSVRVRYKDVPDFIFRHITGSFTVKECRKCKLLFVDPQPMDQKLMKHYPESYGPYHGSLRSSSVRRFLQKEVAHQWLGYGKPKWWKFILLPLYIKLAHLPDHKRGGKILDVGCANGVRLRLFRELGWDAVGIEMSGKAVKEARERGENVIHGKFEDVDIPNSSFDVVYMSHVFEHLRDPHLVLEKIANILRPGGELILIIPNGGSITARVFGRFWLLCNAPRHLFTYQKNNINALFAQHSFVAEKVIYVDTLRNFLPSLALLLGKEQDFFSFLGRFVYILDMFLDTILQPFRIGDAMIIRAKLRRKPEEPHTPLNY